MDDLTNTQRIANEFEDAFLADWVSGLSPEELDQYFAENGVDPVALRDKGKKLNRELRKDHVPNWRDIPKEVIDTALDTSTLKRRADLNETALIVRIEMLLAKITSALIVTTLKAGVANRNLSEYTKEDLVVLLSQVEATAIQAGISIDENDAQS